MFGKLNLYTTLTFIVYPILFTGLLMFLFFTCTNKTNAIFHSERKVIESEELLLKGNVVLEDASIASDTLYASDYDFSIYERCQ